MGLSHITTHRLLKEGLLHTLQPAHTVWQQGMCTTAKNGGEGGKNNTYTCPSENPCLEKALSSLQDLGLYPRSILDFAHILQRCGRDRDRLLALRLHGYMRENKLETHKVLGNYLIPMLVDVGNMHDAQQVFNRFANPNEWSWNSLINGYIKWGKPQIALDLYQEMQKSDTVQPSGHTYVAVIKACANLNDLEYGTKIHAEVANTGLLKRNLFVGNTLIDMYAKCGSLLKAQQVFDRLPTRSVVSWNALITGYVEHGHGEEAVNCFERMQFDGVLPNGVTFLCTLKACGSIRAARKGIEIHVEIERKGLFEKHGLVGTALVDMYSKCGLLAKAQQIFNRLAARDVISWTALITGYAEHGHGLQAIQCFEQMQREGVSPNVITFVGSLKACGLIGAIDKGQEIHAKIDEWGLAEYDVLIGTALVDMYCKLGLLEKAQRVFDKLPVRDIISWNALISGYAEHGLGEKAIKCFEQMQHDGVLPNDVTYICSLKACGSIGAIEKGQAIHDAVESQGLLKSNHVVGNTLVDMYAKCGLLEKAQEAFDKLRVRDVVAWTSLMVGYTEHGRGEEGMECFEKMQAEGVPPNDVTFICFLKACGNIGATSKGVDIHAEIERQGLLERDAIVGTTLVDMYAKCGLLAKAQEVFDRLPIRDGVSWTALMAGHAQLGEVESVLYVFDRMLEEGVKPHLVTFVVLLSMCRRGCLLSRSQTYFETMSKDFGIVPTLEHHTCMVSLLGCAGQLEEAVAVINKLPVCVDNVAWHAVLGVCRHFGSLEFGKHVFKNILQINKRETWTW